LQTWFGALMNPCSRSTTTVDEELKMDDDAATAQKTTAVVQTPCDSAGCASPLAAKAGAAGPSKFKVDSTALNIKNRPGIAYRQSKDSADKLKEVAKWGDIVEGVDEGDGWLRVGDKFLPMTHDGKPMIVPNVEVFCLSQSVSPGVLPPSPARAGAKRIAALTPKPAEEPEQGDKEASAEPAPKEQVAEQAASQSAGTAPAAQEQVEETKGPAAEEATKELVEEAKEEVTNEQAPHEQVDEAKEADAKPVDEQAGEPKEPATEQAPHEQGEQEKEPAVTMPVEEKQVEPAAEPALQEQAEEEKEQALATPVEEKQVEPAAKPAPQEQAEETEPAVATPVEEEQADDTREQLPQEQAEDAKEPVAATPITEEADTVEQVPQQEAEETKQPTATDQVPLEQAEEAKVPTASDQMHAVEEMPPSPVKDPPVEEASLEKVVEKQVEESVEQVVEEIAACEEQLLAECKCLEEKLPSAEKDLVAAGEWFQRPSVGTWLLSLPRST